MAEEKADMPFRKLTRTISALALSACLLGCHGQRGASSDGFKQVLQHYYNRHPVCITLPVSLPATIDADGIEPLRPQLQALAHAGLIETGTEPGLRRHHKGNSSEARTIRYRVASGMAKFLHPGKDRFLGGSALCFARRKIVKVESFAAPTQMMGQTTAQVTYDYKLEALAPWVKDAAIEHAFPAIKSALARSSGTKTEAMDLTDQGWRLERALR